jgi:imidazolonepropionase-like amidohydrolase
MKISKHGAGREAGITRREIIGAAAGIGAASVFNPREAPAADLPGRGEFVIRNAHVSARQVLEMATINGAWDLGFADRTGSLTPGSALM